MGYSEVFKMPANMTITGRTSTITNAFVASITPRIEPNETEIKSCLRVLGLNVDDLRCAYCGDKATEWDHLHPLASNKKPSGYISQIGNLVPACGKCNQSKGNKSWKDWIKSNVNGSPKSRGKDKDLHMRIQRLEEYEKSWRVTPIDFSKLVDKQLWDKYWSNCESLHLEMRRCQDLAEQIRETIAKNLQVPSADK